MNTVQQEHKWSRSLQFFSKENSKRPTRLGVFEPNLAAADDYWVECGLPLGGVDIDVNSGRLDIQLFLGTLDHTVRNVIKLSWQMTASGDEDGLDIIDADGRTTVLRFER